MIPLVTSTMQRRTRAGLLAPAYWTAGADGCRGGWVVVLVGYHPPATAPLRVQARLCSHFDEVVRLAEQPATLAVDIPIGLLERATPGGRICDREARRLLRGRASSVFSPPARPALVNTDYRDAMQRNGGGMSKQSYNILPKITQVDAVLTPALQRRAFEMHPELAFGSLAGAPMSHNKKTPEGRRERVQLLRAAFGTRFRDPGDIRLELGAAHVALDDVIDAYVLALGAQRIFRGEAHRVPAREPPRDAKGLRMEIWY